MLTNFKSIFCDMMTFYSRMFISKKEKWSLFATWLRIDSQQTITNDTIYQIQQNDDKTIIWNHSIEMRMMILETLSELLIWWHKNLTKKFLEIILQSFRARLFFQWCLSMRLSILSSFSTRIHLILSYQNQSWYFIIVQLFFTIYMTFAISYF